MYNNALKIIYKRINTLVKVPSFYNLESFHRGDGNTVAAAVWLRRGAPSRITFGTSVDSKQNACEGQWRQVHTRYSNNVSLSSHLTRSRDLHCSATNKSALTTRNLNRLSTVAGVRGKAWPQRPISVGLKVGHVSKGRWAIWRWSISTRGGIRLAWFLVWDHVERELGDKTWVIDHLRNKSQMWGRKNQTPDMSLRLLSDLTLNSALLSRTRVIFSSSSLSSCN